jgi:hypothetical protein
MSDRLTVSASFSVLMMAIYVLFGDNVVRVPLGPVELMPEAEMGANVKTPELQGNPGVSFKLFN